MSQLDIWSVIDQPKRYMREDDTPAYRAEFAGPDALTSWELISLVTGVPVQRAEDVVGQLTSLNELARADVARLLELGFKRDQAIALRCSMELTRRLNTAQPNITGIQGPVDVVALVGPMIANSDQEHLVVLLTDAANHLIRPPIVLYTGAVDGLNVRVAEVFRQAIKDNAKGITVVHNHPTGDPSPSADDVAVTRAIRQAGELLDIHLLDHVVIGTRGYASLRERGLLN